MTLAADNLDTTQETLNMDSSELSFRTLRAANLARLPELRNAQGEIAHTDPLGHDWSLNDWLVAVCGEVGELANLLKKIRRGDFAADDPANRLAIAEEIADIQIYLDILALQFDFDLGSIVRDKFNKTSQKVGSRVRIDAYDEWHLDKSVTYPGSPHMSEEYHIAIMDFANHRGLATSCGTHNT